MATRQPERRIKRSLILDADILEWIAQQAAAEGVSDSQVARRYLRAAMAFEGLTACPTCGQEVRP